MRAFLTKIEDFFAALGNKLFKAEEEKKEGSEEKKPGFFDRIDAYFAKRDGSFLIWSFFLSLAMMLLIYVGMNVYPFGKSSVLVLDLNGQYVQFFAALRGILHGDGSLLYSFSRSLGGEFLGIYTYYLASPFSWLVALFPEGNILEALLVMFVLKAGCTGLSFGAYLHYTHRPPKIVTVGLSVLYALSSYGIVMQHNTMWMDVMMLAPLVLLGLERLVRQRRPILYVASLTLALMANYYVGYMLCIFTALYFFYIFLANGKEAINPLGERYHFPATLLRTGVYTLLAVGMAALLILPAYYSLTFGKTDFSVTNWSFITKFDIIDFIAKMFPGAYDTVRPEGLPWVYSGTLSLILVPLYFAAKRIPVREKIATGTLAFILFLSMYINTLDVLWHGGQAPNWLNYRYSFFFTLVVLLMAARALTHLRSVDYRVTVAVSGILLLLVVILQKLGLTYTANGVTKEYFDDLNGVWLSVGCLAVYCILLLFLSGHDHTSPRYEPIATILVGVICLEALVNGIFYLRRLHADVTISSHASYHDFYDVYDEPFDYVKENDTTLFYRMDKSFQHTVCDSLVIGYRGLASSTSTLNASAVQFQHALGMKANSHWTEATGTNIASGALLGVKYWVTEANSLDLRKTDATEHYVEYHRDGEGATATVTYLNPYALPIAFAANAAVKDISYHMPRDTSDYQRNPETGAFELKPEFQNALWSPFTRLNATYAALTGNDALTVYDALDVTVTTKGSMKRETISWNHTKFIPALASDKTARIVFTFTAPEDGSAVYCYFPTCYPRTADLYLNGEQLFIDEAKTTPLAIYEGDANFAPILCFDSLEAGEVVTLELCITSKNYNDFYLVTDEPCFYTIDEADLKTATDILKEGGISLTRADDDHFIGTLTAAEGTSLVQTTIPYDAGWQISVNGERVEGYRTLDAMLAFDLPEGDGATYEIELKYRPSIYTLALLIFIVAFLLMGGIVALIILRDKGKLRLEGRGRAMNALLFLLPPPPVREVRPEDLPPAQGGGLFRPRIQPQPTATPKKKKKK